MNILGFQIGKVKGPEVKPAPRQGDIGVMTSGIYHGSDFSYYNPDEIIGNKGDAIYKKMMRDDQVKAVMNFKKSAIISRDWYFDVEHDQETGEPDAQQQEMADLFTEIIERIQGAWSDKLKEVLSAINNGFSVCEKIYDPIQVDGKTYWGLKDIKLRPFNTFNAGGFVVDKHGNLEQIKQVDVDAQDIEIPIDKVIHFVNEPDVDRFYGESDLKAAHRPWWSKDIAIKFQNIHLERHAHGFIFAKVTEGTLQEPAKTDLRNVLENITVHTAMQVPHNVEIKTVQPLNTFAYEKAIQQYNSAIARSVLVPNLLGLSEQGPHGSRSLGDTQFTGFLWVLNEIDTRLCQVLNEQLFRQLAMWNFGSEQFPKYKTEPLSDQEQLELAKGWGELIKSGAVTKSDSDERHIRQQLGMPDKTEDDVDNEPVDQPDLDQWVKGMPDPETIFKELSERPWLRRVNFAKMERSWNNSDSRTSNAMADIFALIKHDIFYTVEKIGGPRSWGNVKPAELAVVAIPKMRIAELRKTMKNQLIDVFNESYEMASRELPRRKFRRIGIGMDKTQAEKFINSRMMKLAGILEQRVLDAVAQTLSNSITYDKSLKDTIAALEKDLADLLPKTELVIPEKTTISGKIPDPYIRKVNIPARLENIARTETGRAINQARLSMFGDPALQGFVQAFEYSAILDDRTTEICEHLNSKVLVDFGHYAPPNHYQCRSVLVPVTQLDEWNGKESPTPRVEPQKGFK